MPFFGSDDEEEVEQARAVRVEVTGQPGMNGGGNAAVVRVYQLSGNSSFQNTPLSSFWRDDEAALGSELVARREVLVYPGETEAFTLKLQDQAAFVGVAADLREPNREAWRKIYPAPAVTGRLLDVSVSTDRVAADVSAGAPPGP